MIFGSQQEYFEREAMSDEQEKIKQEQHWQELAELLGLEPERAAASAPAAPVSAPANSVEPKELRREAEPESKSIDSARGGPEATARAGSALPAPARIDDRREAGRVLSKTENEGKEQPADARVTELEESGRESKRRRGRRSAESSKRAPTKNEGDSSAADAAAEGAAVSDPPGRAEKSKEGRRRGRGRGGQHKKPESENETAVSARAPEEEPAETLPAARDKDDENDEVDNLSDWNVPSWNELIATLYRPER
jgi:hypothetical protein